LSQNNLKADEIDDLFGHRLSDDQILSLYPCDIGIFHKEDYNKSELTITYDTHTAYELRKRNVPFVVWGKEYKNNLRAFVFCKPRPRAALF
jgi:hypothetical protein